MALLLLTLVVVHLAVCLAYAGLHLYQVIRRLAGGRLLDPALLRLRLLGWPHRVLRPELLERRIVWGILAAGVVDVRRRAVRLPDSVEVLVAPRDLPTYRPLVNRVRTRVSRRLEALVRTGRCYHQARPVLSLSADSARPPGRLALQLSFGEATEMATLPSGNGYRAGLGMASPRGAYLRPLRPPGEPMPLRREHRHRIGRLPSCDMVIEQPTVSRYHAVVYQRGGAWYIADEDSTNGTFVNLVPVVSPVELTDADEIRLSPTVSLRFELRSPADPTTLPRPSPPQPN
jgi:hypothetical protein